MSVLRSRSSFRPAAVLRQGMLAFALTAALGGGFFAPPALAEAGQVQAARTTVDIPFEQFTLPNGLRVIVHTDRKAPIVAVNIWYHVGALDEPRGRTGFAHLFEHLMFNGSENHQGEFFDPFEQVGATDMNGTTNSDRTNYFQNVPTTALDMALWMESDRMGHLLGAIDQKTLDEQRGVVQNEKRQGENQPYGQVYEVMTKAIYPEGHPYSHTVIGSMADLNAASLEDVKNWFRTWYGPNNAVLVLAGDIDLKTAKEKVAKYFGDIPASPTMTKPTPAVVTFDEPRRIEIQDNVPQVRIYRGWNIAKYGDPDVERMQLFARVLGGSKSSRLDQRLLHQDKLVDSISASASAQQLDGGLMIMANVRKGVDPALVEKAIDEEVQKLLRDGPTATELEQARTVFKAGFIRGIERIGGFGGKADALAECTVYTGNPGCFRASLEEIETATRDEILATAHRWLDKGSLTLVVSPGERTPLPEDPAVTPDPMELPPVDPKFTTSPSAVDRSKGVPVVEEFPTLAFPELQRAELSNGTKLILAERHDIPVVQMSYEFGGGYAADDKGTLGAASFAMAMLDEGVGELGALEFANRAESLGASLGASASLDGSSAYLSAIKGKLDPSLSLFADMLRKPRFEQKEIDRVKATWLAGIAQEKARPNGAAMRVLPPLLYGEGHPYAIPLSGTGTESSIAALTRDDLVAYHDAYVRPEGATLIVVGDTTMAEIKPRLEAAFGNWKGTGAAPAAAMIPPVERPQAPRVFLIDQPGAIQANIFAGQVMPSTRDDGATEFDFANTVLGGQFSARLNMNLREDKHWAYGAYSFTQGAVGQRPWLAFAPVQIDKTVPALQEIAREIGEYASGKAPPTQAEVDKVKASEIRGLPGSYETARAVMGEIGGIVRYDRPDDYVTRHVAELKALTPEQVAAAATAIDPNALTWVIVGDLSTIEQPIRELKLGEVTVIDASGKAL